MNPTMDSDKIGQALTWIVTLLNDQQVQYQIVGGLVAQAYGARRPLVDIDDTGPIQLYQSVGFVTHSHVYLYQQT